MMIRKLLILALVLVNISCDQASKAVVRDKILENEKISVIKDYLVLTKVENTGAMLGLGAELEPILKVTLLVVLPTIALLVMLVVILFKSKLNQWIILSMTFIIGGGLGNLLDRMLYGSVTDFMHMNFVIFKTGVFNMADVSIMIGAILILICQFIASRNKLADYIRA